MAKKLKLLTLASYNDSYGKDEIAPLFVVNSSKGKHGIGNVSFSALDEFGKATAVTVPRTFIPVDLTQFVPRSSLLKSPRFNRLLSTGYLKIVDNKEATEYLTSDPAAAAEYERIYNTSVAIDASLDMAALEVDTQASMTNAAPDNTQFSEKPFLQSIISRARSGETSDEELISAIRTNSMGMDIEDYELIANQVTQASIKDFCLQEIKDLQEIEAEE